MSEIRSLGTRISRCPRCGEELFDAGIDSNYKEKECVTCGIVFRKRKGLGHRWRMGTEEQFIMEEINIR